MEPNKQLKIEETIYVEVDKKLKEPKLGTHQVACDTVGELTWLLCV